MPKKPGRGDTMETKSISFELKAKRGKREIEGYASTYEKDLVNDIIEKGAFSRTIKERLPKNQIKILWQHDSARPIGLPIHMEEDSKGLYIVGKLTEGVKDADEALALIEDKVVDTMSIGYDVLKDEQTKDGSRLLKELRLYEFSPVTFPANPTAEITIVRKSLNELLGEFDEQKMSTLLKEGRVLSKSNIAAIENAIKSLEQVLEIAGGRNSEKRNQQPPAAPFDQLLAEMKSYTQKYKQ